MIGKPVIQLYQQNIKNNLTMKKSRIIPAVLVFSLLAIFLGSCRNEEADIEADIAVPVSVEDIKLKSIEQFITTNGTVLATQEVLLKAEMGGNYKLLKNPRTGRTWSLGDRVQMGDKIVGLEDQEYVNGIQIKSKEINLEISKDELAKLRNLLEKGGATEREVSNANQTFINAEYSLENAKLQLAKMNVIAPFKGVIVDLPYFTPGNKIDNGAELVTIMDYDRLYMDFQLPEKNIAELAVNQVVRILNYTLPDDTLKGTISQLSPAINPDTRNFKGTFMINNPDLKLRPGSYVKAEIVTMQKDSVIVIDKELIMSRQRGKSVFIVDNSTANERYITTGLENPKEVEVLTGLKVNDRIVMEGFETLGNRSKVKVIR